MPDNPTARFTVEVDATHVAPIVSATGVWGGFSPNGSLVADFFVDTFKPQRRMIMEASAGGIREVERVPPPMPEYVRRTQVSIVFRAEDLRSIGNWFLQYAAVTEAATTMIGAASGIEKGAT